MVIAFPYRLDIKEVQDGDRTLELQLHTLMPKHILLLANCQSDAQVALAWFNDIHQIVDEKVPRAISNLLLVSYVALNDIFQIVELEVPRMISELLLVVYFALNASANTTVTFMFEFVRECQS